MKENNLIDIIKINLNNGYIGDDCAYLKDLGIVVTHDSLIEDIHFKRKWISPYQLGYKSVIANISDILASGGVPKYLTVSLSLPKNTDNSFIEEFYQGAQKGLNGAEIVGGDLTGSTDKISVSIAAIGSTEGRNISSRKNAKIGYKIITKGLHGSSALGLRELYNGGNNKELIKFHLEPTLENDFSKNIATTIGKPYAMMDTSDGIADALFKIAKASKVKIIVDYNKIPHLDFADKNSVLFGGEDYKLVAAIPEEYINLVNDAVIIGEVAPFDGITLDISGSKYINYDDLIVYNHFGDNYE